MSERETVTFPVVAHEHTMARFAKDGWAVSDVKQLDRFNMQCTLTRERILEVEPVVEGTTHVIKLAPPKPKKKAKPKPKRKPNPIKVVPPKVKAKPKKKGKKKGAK